MPQPTTPAKAKPGLSSRFSLKIDGNVVMVASVTGLTMSMTEANFDMVGPKGRYRVNVPGMVEPSTITLTRQLDADKTMWDWAKSCIGQGNKPVYKNGALVGYDAFDAKIYEYEWTAGWPSKIEVSSFDAGNSDIVTEEITLIIFDLQRVS